MAKLNQYLLLPAQNLPARGLRKIRCAEAKKSHETSLNSMEDVLSEAPVAGTFPELTQRKSLDGFQLNA